MKKMSLVIMAAGIGSRFGGLKQVEPAGPSGEAVIHYSIYDAWKAGFDRVVFIIRRDIESDFRERIGRRVEGHIETGYVIQSIDDLPPGFTAPAGRARPWGTGQAVLACRDAVDGPFMVINADDFYGRASFQVIADFLRTIAIGETANFALAGFRLSNTLSEHGHVTRAVCRTSPDGYLEDIKEIFKIKRFPDGVKCSNDGTAWSPLPADSTVSMNCWGFTPRLFEELGDLFPEFLRKNGTDIKAEFLVPEVVGAMVREGRARVKVLPTPEKWFGLTYPEDMPEVRASIRKLIDKGIYPEKIWG